MSCYQLELFERSEVDLLRGEVRDTQEALSNLRRGMFSRHSELEKQNRQMADELERYKEMIRLIQEKVAI